MKEDIYVILAGGVGASKFIQGIAPLVDPHQLKIIVNTGDDIELFGLKICPDLDIITYTLANLIDKEKGWGYINETFNCLNILKKYYELDWFGLGDKDLATHIYRTDLFKKGYAKTQITQKICLKLGINHEIFPMCNEQVETLIKTIDKLMHFEEYYIKYSSEPEIIGIEFKGIKNAKMIPAVEKYLENAKKIIICPSNPIVSIGTILSVGEMRKILMNYRDKVYAISPIVKNAPIKGPADKLLKYYGLEVSCVGVAKYYKDIMKHFIIDELDRSRINEIENLGINAYCFDTMMTNQMKKENLARHVLSL